MSDAQKAVCGVCGEPMPPGEEMFKYHGYSGPCPKPPLPKKPPPEFAWVIERGDSQPSAPTYWSGPDQWSQDHLDAVRFSRKQDAERVACRLGQGYHRIAEHGWG